jgi:predicted transposase YbfD/YdcC
MRRKHCGQTEGIGRLKISCINCLDIGFREDDCQIKETNAVENLTIIRHIGLNLLKQETSCQRGIKTKRKKAGWSEDYLLKVLSF